MKIGSITIGTELDTKEFDAQILQVERRINEIEKELSDNAKLKFLSDREVEDLNVELEKTRNKLVQLYKQKAKLAENKGMQSLSNGIKGVGDGLSVAIKRVARLALALFSIRTAYNAIRSASTNLAGYDEQYATNLEYIRYVLTQAIAPVLRWIVQKAMELLQLINMIVNSLFGINLFASGSAESFQKMKAGASGVSKAVKEIRKQLMGFDEINMLTEQSDTGTSAGGSGIKMPDLDLAKIEGEPPKWLEWILKHKDEILATLAGIAGVIGALKVSKFLKNVGLATKSIGAVKALGIGAMIGGITYSIKGLIAYLKDASWLNFGKIIQGIGIAVAGLAAVITSLPTAVAGAVVFILGTIVKYWDRIKVFLQDKLDWLYSKIDWVKEKFGIIGETIYRQVLNVFQFILDGADAFFVGLKNIFDGIIRFFKGIFTANWKEAWEGLKDIAKSVIDMIISAVKALFKLVIETIKNIANFIVEIVKTVWNIASGLMQGIIELIKNVILGIGGIISNTIDGVYNVISQVGSAIWDFISYIASGIKDMFVNAIRAVADYIWDSIKTTRDFFVDGAMFIYSIFKAIVNEIIEGINTVIWGLNQLNLELPDFLGGHKFGVNIGYIPKLKSGGIINMPNKGTMLGGTAIGGEAGREGVLPLTDSQAMSQLGAEIGRNVIINLTTVTEMNGRVIGKELKQVRGEQEFAYNN